MILTETLAAYQSKENSLAIWKAHHGARWLFNNGVVQAFENKLSNNELKQLVNSDACPAWLEMNADTRRACIIEGAKSIRLARKTLKNNKKPAPKSYKPYLRRKRDDQRQPALPSYHHVTNKNGVIDAGICEFTLKPGCKKFDKQIRSFQIVETTKKITRKTRPEDRTYELHVQYEHAVECKQDGDTITADLGAKNMMGVKNADNGSHQIIRHPDTARRRPGDEISKAYSAQSKRKPNSRNYNRNQHVIRKKGKKITNNRKDFARKTLAVILKNVKIVVMEDLNVKSMIAKYRAYATKNGKKRADRPKGSKAKNRTILYGIIGYTKEDVRHYCQKHGIYVTLVKPQHTSIKCGVCGHIDKKSRNRDAFVCTRCKQKNHADLNAPENIFYLALSGAAGNVVCKQKDGAGRLALKVKRSCKEKTNPDRFQFGTRSQTGTHCGGAAGQQLSTMVPLLLEKHESCTKYACNFCM